jgi:hypothetical protein
MGLFDSTSCVDDVEQRQVSRASRDQGAQFSGSGLFKARPIDPIASMCSFQRQVCLQLLEVVSKDDWSMTCSAKILADSIRLSAGKEMAVD